MSFESTKREWSELYSLFRLLADAVVYAGTPEVKRNENSCLPIALIQRNEHNGLRRYIVEGENIHLVGEEMDKIVLRTEFDKYAHMILSIMKSTTEESVECPDELETFLNEIAIFDIEANTDDRTDFYVAFGYADAPLIGFNVRSRIGRMFPLLDGGRSANLKYELSGLKFATPMIDKVNALKTINEVADRMLLIERLGGILRYSDVADKVFRCNLSMIDLHFPRLLAEMLKIMHLDGITKVSELTERMKEINPLKIREELITKHHFYEYKIKQFLLTLALGMRPAKLFTGIDSAIAGHLLVEGSGDILCYQKSDKETFEDYLFRNTRLDKGSTEKDKYGYLERENGVYYFKLNLKIVLTKR
ncbi:MAG: HpaII family restriction endonuclease [Bacteroides sp.]